MVMNFYLKRNMALKRIFYSANKYGQEKLMFTYGVYFRFEESVSYRKSYYFAR